MLFGKKRPSILLRQNIRPNCRIFGFGRLPKNIRHTPISCVVVHLLGLRRGGGRWWWHPISFPYASVRVFSHGVFFGAVLSGPFPVLSFLKVCHLGAWWFRGIPVGFLSCPLPLGHILIVSCRIPFSCFFWGGGGREREYTIINCYYAQL